MWFHIRLLEKCNLKCISCYAQKRDRSQIMDLTLFKDVLQEIKHVKKSDNGISVIYLSGGEPLLHPDFLVFLDYCFSRFERVSILTNGLLVKKFIPDLLPYRDKLCVQVSLDGDEKTNDFIRGKDVYTKVLEALTLLNEQKIKHWISYTVSKINRHCYRDILTIAKNTNSTFNNVTPYVGDVEQMLDYLQWKEFKYDYEKYSSHLGIAPAHGLNCCGFSYHCGAFYSGVTINPDGSLAGCARINNVIGYYTDMNRHLLSFPMSITETCMIARWGEIKNMNFIQRLE